VIASLISVNGALTSLDLSNNALCGVAQDPFGGVSGTYTAEGITAIADALRVNGALTVTNLLGNQLDAESAKMLAEVAKQKGISLCGIRRDQTTADFLDCNYYLKPPDAILLASDLSQAIVTGSLTRVDVRGNKIAGDGASQLAAAVLGNLKIEMFNGIPIKEMRADSLTELDLKGSWNKYVGVEGGMVVAGLIPVMGALTKLSLAWNKLEEEGTMAICKALKQNKTLKELDLSGQNNIGGEAGAKHVADMLHVNGVLTKLSLAWNKLEEEGTKAICEALKQNKTLKELDLSGDNTIGGEAGAKHVADMLGVNGGLTSLDLSGNALRGLVQSFGGGVSGTYTAEGITAIANALRVNGALTKIE
jgi:hypothetical protein